MTKQAVRQYVYYTQGGRITAVKTVQEGMVAINAPEGDRWLQHDGEVSGETHFVASGMPGFSPQVVTRPRMNLTVTPKTFTVDGEFRVTGVPLGAVFRHPSGQETINDGTVEWSTNVAGRYTLSLESFPYAPEEWDVEVTP